MLLTYAALYFGDLSTALSRSPQYLQAVNVDTTAVKIDRSRLYFVYYCKKTGRAIKKIIFIFVSKEGLRVSGLLILIAGWPLGIWAIATKSSLPYGPRVSAGVGFAVGFPAMFIIWVNILESGKFAHKVGKPGLIALSLYVHCGLPPSPTYCAVACVPSHVSRTDKENQTREPLMLTPTTS